MSAKDKPAISKEVSFDTGNISTKLDVQLTKDDLIEALVEHEQSRIEDAVDAYEEEVANIETEIFKEHDKLLDRAKAFAKEKAEDARLGLEKLLKKELTITANMPIKIGTAPSRTGNDPYYNHNYGDRSRAPVRKVHVYKPNIYDVQVLVTDEIGHTWLNIKLPSKMTLSFKESKRSVELRKKQDDIRFQIATLNHDASKVASKGRRAKSKLVMELLKDSDSGKGLMTKLQQATKKNLPKALEA